MPFMVGQVPIRRTLNYLRAGKLILKNSIQIFSINYNTYGRHHIGARDFVFWLLPQLQYKNPLVQVITFKNMTPTPFVRCYYDDGRQMLIDIDSQSKEEILDHLIKVVGKTEEFIAQEQASVTKHRVNPADFGVGCMHGCMCDIPGQLPCPGVVPLPNHMRGKYIYKKEEM